MIILKHLTVERFRLLRELDLHFPQRGCILIQGPNEAGKSTLLECMYFALYGESLASDRGKRSLDDLILYGMANAVVTLTFLVGATELRVSRTIERGKGQSVALSLRRLGVQEEELITQLEMANERIVAELGHVNGETLRNSCLIEQKGLDRLERLRGVEREATIRRLLGLEKLTRLAQHFTVTPEDELAFNDCAERLRLAEIQARIPVLSRQLDEIESGLDAVKIYQDLAECQQQEDDIAEQEHALQQMKNRRQELKSRQGRLQLLKRADVTLAEIIASYDEIAEARRELPVLEKQIAELERREREELPVLEKRVEELGELTRSFGTLQRMSNDLLTAVDTIKDLERDLQQQDEVQSDLKSLEDQVAHARVRLKEARQALNDLEERRRAGRPQLEARLQRLNDLTESIAALRQMEDQYSRRMANKELAEEKKLQYEKVLKDLRETEQELALVEAEAKQTQLQADTLEQTWRQLAVRPQVEEWLRLKGLTQGLSQAEQHLAMARQHQGQLTQAAKDARSSATTFMYILAVCVVLCLLCFGLAAFEALQSSAIFASIVSILALLLGAGAAVSYRNYGKARADEKGADRQMQEAISRVSAMMAAREAAVRMGGNNEALAQIEHEIRSLGGNVPRSLEEAQSLLQQTYDHDESLADVQQLMKEKLDEANAARNQVNVTMEAVATLRKERVRLDELRKKEGWDNLEENMRNDQAEVERLHKQIAVLAGQEGLPLSSVNVRLQSGISFDNYSVSGKLSSIKLEDDQLGVPGLETLVESTMKATERELASLDGKLDLVTDLAEQAKIHQEALDVLLTRRRVIEERNLRYQTNSPAQQIERARGQQVALRQALQSLQDSLRLRVRPLGIAFGQAAISNAENVAAKQLEELHVTLGNKIILQEKVANYTVQLKLRQESLSEYYKQLAKFSNSLGSWIVPPNPFAEALVALRNRCLRELQELNETGILKELESLVDQEGAAKAKIELCYQEIEDAHQGINALLVQRGRPAAKGYLLKDLMAVWPLLGKYSGEDHCRLEKEYTAIEQELTSLEEQELALSTHLQTGDVPLDLEAARVRMELMERSYQTKKRGNLLVQAVNERLMRKMLPRTEYYMQQILPLLTSGRYHDMHLTTEPEESAMSGGPFQLEVWESAAGEYVSKSALSGGAADQLSLALRLAFAIAALPRELNAAPGFVLLDEPLSSFDRGRAQALVEVVTGEVLSQHFEQIVLISHSNAFDPAMFPYHVYLDNGVVVESNLPVVYGLSPAATSGNSKKSAHVALSAS